MMTPLTAIAARTSVSPGHVIAPLRLADTALAALLRPGDVVDVIAADTAGRAGASSSPPGRESSRSRICRTSGLVPVLTVRSCSSTWMPRRRRSWPKQPLLPHSASSGGSADPQWLATMTWSPTLLDR